jgi:hypothetical protein
LANSIGHRESGIAHYRFDPLSKNGDNPSTGTQKSQSIEWKRHQIRHLACFMSGLRIFCDLPISAPGWFVTFDNLL